MTTGTVMVQNALMEIGAHSIASPADPEAIEKGVAKLNGMLHELLSCRIDIGVPQINAPGDELGEPPDTTNGLTSNLALLMAPLFDNGKAVVSQELRDNARKGHATIRRLYYVAEIPDKVVSSTLPRGQGNHADLLSRRFAGRGATLNAENG